MKTRNCIVTLSLRFFTNMRLSTPMLECNLNPSPLRETNMYVPCLQQLQQALTLATNRADEAEAHWSQSRDRVAQLEADQVELRHKIGTCMHKAEEAIARATDLENASTRSREEADQL